MFRNKSVDVHQFAMVPKADIPRSSFRMQKTYKTTFDAGYLVPIHVQEILPGDTFNLKATIFARLSTPIFPIMDNIYLDTFWFFVPNRLVWDNWKKFMGEQANPGDSISYVVPQLVSPVAGFAVNSVYDYLGLPTVGQVGAGNTISVNALPLRAYNLIYNEWFRDQNIATSQVVSKGDGPDSLGSYGLFKRGKRHDYFTACLPFLQKGTAVSLGLTGNAPVRTNATALVTGAQTAMHTTLVSGAAPSVIGPAGHDAAGVFGRITGLTGTPAMGTGLYPDNLYADLSTATAATINQLRQSFAIQRLLERDARGGTRYTELVRAHFGVISPDARQQRPEYLGGGTINVNLSQVAQTSATGLTGATTPLAALSAIGTATGHNGFTQSFTEHGHIIGIISARADLTYQQGLHKMWSRSTKYDFYFPAFAHLGEQAVLNREIYADGSAADTTVFGYQERWAEYRYNPSQITGLFKSTSAGTIDPWHLAQRFTAAPTLNTTFLFETPPMDRILAVGAAAQGKHFIMDSFIDIKAARPLPLYSVPGLVDHF